MSTIRVLLLNQSSPNQVLTHTARVAAKQLNKAPLVAVRVRAKGSGQSKNQSKSR